MIIWWILLGIWAVLFIISIAFAKVAGETHMWQPILFGLLPIVGSLFSIGIYCIVIVEKGDQSRRRATDDNS